MKTLIKAIAISFIFIVNTQASLLDDLPEIKYESFTLDNGLTVVVHDEIEKYQWLQLTFGIT